MATENKLLEICFNFSSEHQHTFFGKKAQDHDEVLNICSIFACMVDFFTIDGTEERYRRLLVNKIRLNEPPPLTEEEKKEVYYYCLPCEDEEVDTEHLFFIAIATVFFLRKDFYRTDMQDFVHGYWNHINN